MVDDNFDWVFTKVNLPLKNKVYTIRVISKREKGVCILLEEISNEKHPVSNREYAFLSSRFRELLPPISNIEETINLNLKEYEPINPNSTHPITPCEAR